MCAVERLGALQTAHRVPDGATKKYAGLARFEYLAGRTGGFGEMLFPSGVMHS